MKVPETGQKTHFDDALPGFGVRVSQGGSKSFVVMYGERRQLKTLGRYPELKLADARLAAKRVQAEAPDQTTIATPLPELSFTEARERFLLDSRERNKPRTADDYHRLLHRHFVFEADVDSLTRADIMTVIGKLSKTPSEQRHAFLAIRTMMNWCVKRGVIENSPVPSLSFQTTSRSRVLSDDELRAVWQQAASFGYPYGTIVQLLILTGQRKGEIAHLRRSWIGGGEIVFPAGFTKNKREHRLPLGKWAEALIAPLPETADLFFPSRISDEKPFNGWSKCKRRFDQEIEVSPYTLHDLRRTFSSKHAQIGTPIHVTEKLLNHASGTVSGVAAIYNRHTYADEMRVATEAYEAHLAKLMGGCKPKRLNGK